MPIYEYRCEACGHEFEALVRSSDTPVCEKCASPKLARLLSLPAAPGSDAADALACAICHAHGGFGLGALATSGLRIRKGRML